MTRPHTVDGLRLRLRPVELNDAAYVHRLRTDPRLNSHLSPVGGTVADQRVWIEQYMEREAEGREIYFVIERRADECPCGVVRLYGIEGDRFTWGSWILDEHKPPKAALESALLVYDTGFGKFGCHQAVFDVRRENVRTLAFHHRFGAIETGSDDRDVFFSYPRSQYLRDRPRLWAALS